VKKQNFDLGWDYRESGAGMLAEIMGGAEWQPVSLPHDAAIHKPRSKDAPSGSLGGHAWAGIVSYRKRFEVPEAWRGLPVQVEFEGVYMNAEVSVNGNLVKLHPYGYTSFIVDLAPYLKYGAENELTVVVNNSAQPNARWYSGTGIYRHVWLRTGGAAYIQPWGVFVTTPAVDPAASTVKIVTEVAGSSAGAALRSTVRDAGGAVVAQVESPVAGAQVGSATSVIQTLVVRDARLWSVDEPNLYSLESEVLVDGDVVDSETTPFGIRSIAFDAENGFRLNGVPIKMKGGCVHHDNGILGAASYDRAEERKVELLKASGFNAVRCAHNPPAPAFLDACDRLGMLVMDESFDMWRMGKQPYDYHLYFEKHWQEDTESMVKRDRNHPSIVIWSIGNEIPECSGVSGGYDWARKQADFVRALDPTRPVTSALAMPWDPQLMAEGGSFLDFLDATISPPAPGQSADTGRDYPGDVTRPFCEALDVVGYNYVYQRYEPDQNRFPGRVLIGTETFPFAAYETWKETERLPHVVGDFVWTSLDYLGESGIGKIDIDTLVPFFMANVWPFHVALCGDIDITGTKRPQSYYRDLLWGVREAPFIAVVDPQLHGKTVKFTRWGWDPVQESWNFPGAEGKPTQVHVYAADDEVELLINGESQGRQPAGDANKFKAVFEVTYQPGTIEAVGYTGGKETSRTRLTTGGDPTALRAAADRSEIRSAFGDLAYITVDVVDKDGVVNRSAENEVTFTLTGPGELIAVGSGNPTSEELYVGDRRKAFQGTLTAVVRSSGQPGLITLTATADGLEPAEVQVTAKE
jgi:beta-galactosidase